MSINPEGEHIRPWADNKKLTVVNFFGGPGTGKSTTAAELFALMKKKHYRVEMIREIAKDHVWERRDNIFREQDYIFAHQHRLQRRLVGHDIDYVVLDSALLLGLFYAPDDFPPSFRTFVKDVVDSYNNINIYLQRSDSIPYVEAGRNQTFEQARMVDMQVYQYLCENCQFHVVDAGTNAALSAFDIIQHATQKL
jgi:AAA domain